jgi:hypothetical protein
MTSCSSGLRILLLGRVRFKIRVQVCYQSGKVVICGFPNFFKIHVVIVVNQNIPHSRDELPWDFGKKGAGLW